MKIRPIIRSRFLAPVLLAFLLPALPARAVLITNLVDSETEFSGDFSASGRVDYISGGLVPQVFADLPVGSGYLWIQRSFSPEITSGGGGGGRPDRDGRGGGGGSVVVTHPARVLLALYPNGNGTPDSPIFSQQLLENSAPIPDSFSGTYTNGANGGTVDWSFTNLANTWGETGTFSGSFSFVLRQNAPGGGGTTPMPSGGATALMLGIGLLGLAGVKRKLRGA